MVKGTKEMTAKLPGPLPCCIFSCFFLLLPLLFNPCFLLLPLHQQLLHPGLPLRFQGSLALLPREKQTLTALLGMKYTGIRRNCILVSAEPKWNTNLYFIVPLQAEPSYLNCLIPRLFLLLPSLTLLLQLIQALLVLLEFVQHIVALVLSFQGVYKSNFIDLKTIRKGKNRPKK